MNMVVVGLCGPTRHDIPNVNNFLFPTTVERPLDFVSHYTDSLSFIDSLSDDTHLELYITGLTPVLKGNIIPDDSFSNMSDSFVAIILTSFLSAWVKRNDEKRRAGANTRHLTLYHYNRDNNDYEAHLF